MPHKKYPMQVCVSSTSCSVLRPERGSGFRSRHGIHGIPRLVVQERRIVAGLQPLHLEMKDASRLPFWHGEAHLFAVVANSDLCDLVLPPLELAETSGFP